MKELDRKFILDELSIQEFDKLRNETKGMTDENIGAIFLENWKEECGREYDPLEERNIRRLHKIDRKIHAGTPKKQVSSIIGWVCCACLGFALIVSYASNSRRTWELTSSDVIIKTADGEKGTVVLPDGSKVNLNYGSRLSYNQADFIRGKRNVEFSGEAYFDIRKMNGKPFVINSPELCVNVTGTKFNFSNRKDNNSSTLALFEGRLTMISSSDRKMTEVSPGQIASYEKSSGLFELKSSDYIESMSAWTRGEIVFRRASLPRVLEILGHYYGYKVTASSDIRKLNNTFSGTLPLSDINDAMTVLELLYPINSVILNDRITVSIKK